MNVNFSKFVNSFPIFKLVWKQSKVKGSNHYQKIIKCNSEFTKKCGISDRNIITPAGIPLTVEGVSIKGDELSFTIPVNSPELNDLVINPTTAHLILYFYEPGEEDADIYQLNSIVTQLTDKSMTGNYKLKLQFEDKIMRNFKCYRKVILFFVLYSSTPNPKKIFWSSTFAHEIRI